MNQGGKNGFLPKIEILPDRKFGKLKNFFYGSINVGPGVIFSLKNDAESIRGIFLT